MFYTYNQNNSGGGFIMNANVTHYVIIEAGSADEADRKAEEVGIYFDGTDDDGPDCPCCGDRWSRAWSDGTETPEIFGEPIEEHADMWAREGEPYAYVYYKDGTKRGFTRA